MDEKLNKKIYVIQGATGFPSDTYFWLVGAYLTKTKADTKLDKLNNFIAENKESIRRGSCPPNSEDDKMSEVDYCLGYGIEEVDLYE